MQYQHNAVWSGVDVQCIRITCTYRGGASGLVLFRGSCTAPTGSENYSGTYTFGTLSTSPVSCLYRCACTGDFCTRCCTVQCLCATVQCTTRTEAVMYLYLCSTGYPHSSCKDRKDIATSQNCDKTDFCFF